MVKTKSGNVKLVVLSPALAHIFYHLELFHRTYFMDHVTELVITSINDGQHVQNSRHYTNEALDVRSHNFPTQALKQLFRAELEEFLGPKFRVIFEDAGRPNEHFHVQVRKGMTYP